MMWSSGRAGWVLAAGLLLFSVGGIAQAQPVRPTPEQAAALLQTRPDLVGQLRQRLLTSGLSADQVRARLKAEGYPETLLDGYLPGAAAGGAPSASATDALAAMRALGVLDADDAAQLGMLARPNTPEIRPRPIVDPGARRGDGLSDSSAVLFGLDIFRSATSRFDANMSGPVDQGYRLGPGDELVLILTGDVEVAHTLEVTRSGFVVIPQVGQLAVANLTLAQLEDLLYARLSRVYSGVQRGEGATTRFSVNVSRLRSNQIYVVGDVVAPGAYRVSSAGTALTALYAAGGPSDRGSLRRVEIRRGGRVAGTLDVYAYLLRGDASQDMRLQQGDVLFVPVHGARIRVDGEVTRPATYELRAGEQLADVLSAAGGLRATATSRRVLIERIVPAGERTGLGASRASIDVSLDASGRAPGFVMSDGDVVRVARIDDRVRDRIEVAGHVWTPGPQGYTPGLTLEQALRRAGGVKPDAYLGRVLVSRLNSDSTRTQLRVMLRDTTGATIEPFVLQADDEVTAFSRTAFRAERYVAIAGAVKKGGRFPYREGMTLRDLALLAGGLTDYADLRQAEIARRPDSASALILSVTERVPLDSGYLFADGRVPPVGAREIPLKPYDNILVFADPDRRSPITVQVTGEVRYPGTYTLRTRNERLSALLERVGGVTSEGDLTGGYFSRRVETSGSVEKLVREASSVRDTRTGQVTASASDTARLEGDGSRVRVGVDLLNATRRVQSSDNLFLRDGDSLHVPARQQVVTVRGEVNAPTAVVASGQALGSYIAAAGGGTPRGRTRGAYVIQPNGKIQKRSHLLWVIALDPKPRPGATVVVPAKGEQVGGTSLVQTIGIVAQTLAAAAAALAITR